MTIIKEPVKGFRDYTGIEAIKRREVQRLVESVFSNYGFEPAETPVIEDEDFVRGENPSDEAVSDTYKLTDKGNRKLALRYEFTFQLKRIVQGKKMPYKRYQIGPVFRDEPVTGNRSRQFTTCEVDTVGSTLRDDAEILSLANSIIKSLSIGDVEIFVNNRKLLNEILAKEGVEEKNRMQVIREIDKLDKLSESDVSKNLKRYGADSIIKIFSKPQSYFKKYDSYSEIVELKKYCDNFGIEIIFQPSLARGLSYYNGTIFEIKSKGMKETILGGGSYLVNDYQGVGFGTSIERLSVLANIDIPRVEFLIVSLSQDERSISIAQSLRNNGKSCIVYYGKPSKALDYANSYGISRVVFVGKQEVESKKFKIKDMATGKELTVSEKDLLKVSKK